MNRYTKARSANSTGDGVSTPVPTTTEPTGDGVFDVPLDANSLVGLPYGTGPAASTFTAIVTSWERIGTLWIPREEARAIFALSTVIGVAGSPILNTERFVDLAQGYDNYGSPSAPRGKAGSLGWLKVTPIEAEKIQFTFTLGTATDANLLFKWVARQK